MSAAIKSSHASHLESHKSFRSISLRNSRNTAIRSGTGTDHFTLSYPTNGQTTPPGVISRCLQPEKWQLNPLPQDKPRMPAESLKMSLRQPCYSLLALMHSTTISTSPVNTKTKSSTTLNPLSLKPAMPTQAAVAFVLSQSLNPCASQLNISLSRANSSNHRNNNLKALMGPPRLYHSPRADSSGGESVPNLANPVLKGRRLEHVSQMPCYQ